MCFIVSFKGWASWFYPVKNFVENNLNRKDQLTLTWEAEWKSGVRCQSPLMWCPLITFIGTKKNVGNRLATGYKVSEIKSRGKGDPCLENGHKIFWTCSGMSQENLKEIYVLRGSLLYINVSVQIQTHAQKGANIHRNTQISRKT